MLFAASTNGGREYTKLIKMKTKNKISKSVAVIALVAASATASLGQTNLGASCGCPPVGSRPSVLLSTLSTPGAANSAEFNASQVILDCSKNWILDKRQFLPPGKTLTIMPGTVLKGRAYSTSDSSACLIIERGARIYADGTEDCPIVFTAEADPMDGTYPLSNIGKWGGLLIAGKATNNLTVPVNQYDGITAGKIGIATGLGIFEGFAVNDSRLYFGADINGTVGPVESFDDNDNSGILRYVSLRHTGANLQVGAEINGLTLGSVGRGTIINYVDIISGADDGIEFFGGTVNVKHISMMFGNDDNFDWDLGWSGKGQFLFVLKSPQGYSAPANDNGFESDADDQRSNALPRSHPVIYNATMIGNSKTSAMYVSDESGPAAIKAKELTEGEIYNSVFANFQFGLDLIQALGSNRVAPPAGAGESYHNWSTQAVPLSNGSQSLKVKNNTFIGVTSPLTINKSTSSLVSADTAQFFTTDGNTILGSAPSGFDYSFAISGNTITDKVDPSPNPALATSLTPPVDGFFTPANYRGAFAPTGASWLQAWTYATVLNAVVGTQPCATDINQDGITNNVDFLILLGQFNQSCQ